MKISSKGIELIKSFEGCRLSAYKCPAGVWTIGYGHTLGVTKGQKITAQQAEDLLKGDLEVFEDNVDTHDLNLTIGQYDALVSFSFNVGMTALNRSTLLKKLKAGDTQGSADEFLKWNKAGGKVLLGLIARRKAERRLFLS